jgi:hypothetical protein
MPDLEELEMTLIDKSQDFSLEFLKKMPKLKKVKLGNTDPTLIPEYLDTIR